MTKKALVLLFLLLGITACNPLVQVTPPPSPQPLRVVFTPILRPWIEPLHQCALSQPQIALILEETSPQDPAIGSSEVMLWLGEPDLGISGQAVVLGTDEIILVAGKSVGLREMNKAQLQNLYADPEGLYQTWTYPEGNELRAVFDQLIFGEHFSAPNSFLAPNPGAMLEAMAADPLAVGYIPASWATGKEKTIPLEAPFAQNFKQPVLALVDSEPQGAVRTFLACLQSITP